MVHCAVLNFYVNGNPYYRSFSCMTMLCTLSLIYRHQWYTTNRGETRPNRNQNSITIQHCAVLNIYVKGNPYYRSFSCVTMLCTLSLIYMHQCYTTKWGETRPNRNQNRCLDEFGRHWPLNSLKCVGMYHSTMLFDSPHKSKLWMLWIRIVQTFIHVKTRLKWALGTILDELRQLVPQWWSYNMRQVVCIL